MGLSDAMNMPELVKSLRLHEGDRNLPYEDEGGILTIGVGHNLERPISKAAISQILQDDIAEAVSELNRAFKGWDSHDSARQNVLVELMFNLGANRLKGFVNFWAAMGRKDYDAAALELLDSRWAKQVKEGRANRLAGIIRTGEI